MSSGFAEMPRIYPFADQSFDLVVSNLTIQWCENPLRVFSELFRVMKPGAQASVSTLAEQTLMELKESWAAVDRLCAR